MGLIGRRGGPAPRRRARSLEAGLLRLRAAHARTCPHAGKWGGDGSPSLVTRHTRVFRGRAPTFGWAATARLAIARAALRMRLPARTQLHTRERAQAGLARGLCRAPPIAHAAAGGAREARAFRGRAACTRIGPGARAAPHTQPHSRAPAVLALAPVRSPRARPGPGSCQRRACALLSLAALSWFVSRGRLSGEGGSCSCLRCAAFLPPSPPSCLVPPLLLGLPHFRPSLQPPPPGPRADLPHAACRRGHDGLGPWACRRPARCGCGGGCGGGGS